MSKWFWIFLCVVTLCDAASAWHRDNISATQAAQAQSGK